LLDLPHEILPQGLNLTAIPLKPRVIQCATESRRLFDKQDGGTCAGRRQGCTQACRASTNDGNVGK